MKVSQLYKSTGLWFYDKKHRKITLDGLILKLLTLNFKKGEIEDFVSLLYPDEQRKFIEFLTQDDEQLLKDIEILSQ